MQRSRNRIISVLVVLVLLVAVPSVFAAGPPTNTHEVVDGQVDWTLPPGQCGAAPAGLTGSGQRHAVINTRTNPDGSMVITINDVVRGTAKDITGTGTYKFLYENHSIEWVPAGGGAHQISMEDNFVLNGNGSVGHLAVGFNWRWTFTPPAGEFDQWPPVDNWQQINTRGDPLRCDPI
jgi:hypothetical protein